MRSLSSKEILDCIDLIRESLKVGISIEDIEIISEHEQKRRNIHVKSLIEMEDERFIQQFKLFKETAV